MSASESLLKNPTRRGELGRGQTLSSGCMPGLPNQELRCPGQLVIQVDSSSLDCHSDETGQDHISQPESNMVNWAKSIIENHCLSRIEEEQTSVSSRANRICNNRQSTTQFFSWR